MSSTAPKNTMASNGIDESDTPAHDRLGKDCHLKVEYVSQTVKEIKSSLVDLAKSQRMLSQLPSGHPNAEIVQRMEGYVANLMLELRKGTDDAATHFDKTLRWLTDQMQTLNKTIVAWKKEQRLSLVGGPDTSLEDGLKRLQHNFEILETLADKLVKQIDLYLVIIDGLTRELSYIQGHLERCQQVKRDTLKQKQQVESFIQHLLCKGMIVYQGPPPIASIGGMRAVQEKNKSKVSFHMKILFLAGRISGRIQENMEVEPLIITGQQARDIAAGVLNPVDKSLKAAGVLSSYSMEMVEQTGECMSANFLKARIGRVDKIPNQEEAKKAVYHVLYRVVAQNGSQKRKADGQKTGAGNDEKDLSPFWAISWPFYAASNLPHQERYRRPFMLWVLSFNTKDETCETVAFNETVTVPWSAFFEALETRFQRPKLNSRSEAEPVPLVLKRGLKDHEAYFRSMIGLPKEKRPEEDGVSFHMFYKARIRPNVSFADWYYAALDYVTKYPAYWESRILHGFASREMAEKMLQGAKGPSMVLKFSETNPGHLGASYINWPDRVTTVIEHILFDIDGPDFANKSLAELVRSSPKLNCLAKILPANQTIKDLYKLDGPKPTTNGTAEKTVSGYIKPELVFTWGDRPDISPLANPSENFDSNNGPDDADDGEAMPLEMPAYVPGIDIWTSSSSPETDTSSPASRQSADSSSGGFEPMWPPCRYQQQGPIPVAAHHQQQPHYYDRNSGQQPSAQHGYAYQTNEQLPQQVNQMHLGYQQPQQMVNQQGYLQNQFGSVQNLDYTNFSGDASDPFRNPQSFTTYQ